MFLWAHSCSKERPEAAEKQNYIPLRKVFCELNVCRQSFVNFVFQGKFGSLLFSQIGFIELFKDDVMGYVMLRIIF